MELLGRGSAIILNNPDLIHRDIRHADAHPSKTNSGAPTKLHVGITRVLRVLAANIELRPTALTRPSRRGDPPTYSAPPSLSTTR
jgi:hypothetical protein